MSTPAEARDRLNALATELGERATQLSAVERDLEPVEAEYEQFISNHEIGVWMRYEAEGKRPPPEKLRLKMAMVEMSPDLLGKYAGLRHSRDRLRKRISTLKAEVEAQRSILSALKAELEASS